MTALEKFVNGEDELTKRMTARGENHRVIKRKIFDNPTYDPLWGSEADSEYLYISWRYENREDFVTCEYEDKIMNEITAIIPRLVIDFPYMMKDDAERLEFNHEYILENFEKKKILGNKN